MPKNKGVYTLNPTSTSFTLNSKVNKSLAKSKRPVVTENGTESEVMDKDHPAMKTRIDNRKDKDGLKDATKHHAVKRLISGK